MELKTILTVVAIVLILIALYMNRDLLLGSPADAFSEARDDSLLSAAALGY